MMNDTEINTGNNVNETEDIPETSAETPAETPAAESASEIPCDVIPEEPVYRWSFDAQAEKNKKEKKKSARRGALIYSVTVTFLFLVCAGVLLYLVLTTEGLGPARSQETLYSDRTVYIRETDAKGDELSLQEVYSSVLPSTVGITKETAVGLADGSGFFYGTDGYIVTNYHVTENALKLTVRLYDGSEYTADYVGGDALSDVAVIKINAGDKELRSAKICSSEGVLVGDTVCAIGCPAGLDYFGTMTVGHVSYELRTVKIYDAEGLIDKKMKLIQMDCIINHGNSGGPLCNTHGEVVGINTMKLGSDYEGMCFAIPMTGAKKIIDGIIETGSYTGNSEVASHGVSLGVSCVSVEKGVQCLAEGMTDWTPGATGLAIAEVTGEQSSAYGYLQKYDIITEFNGRKVTDVYAVREILESLMPGDTVTMKVFRDGEMLDISFRLK